MELLNVPANTSRTEWEKGYKTREITAVEWERQRATFKQLYEDGLDLTEVRRIMAEEHDFYAKYVGGGALIVLDLDKASFL